MPRDYPFSAATAREAAERLRNPETDSELPHLLRLLDSMDDAPNPTISNIDRRETLRPSEWRAWVSFRSREYRQRSAAEWEAPATLDVLAGLGWTFAPLSLVKYDDYRPGVHCGTCDEQADPPTKSYYRELKWCEPLAPFFVRPSDHGHPELVLSMANGHGERFRVAFSMPHVGATVHARRKEVRGDWHYERGTVKLTTPDAWHTLCRIREDGYGEGLAMLSARSGAATVGDGFNNKGLDGWAYWEQIAHEQGEWPLSPGDTARLLVAHQVDVEAKQEAERAARS